MKPISFVISKLGGLLMPVRSKRYHELRYWRSRKKKEQVLSNDHYAYFYTKHFDLEPSIFEGKVILDIGCGPRGSLEWASMAARRIGLDPLADEYFKLGANEHAMEYLASPSEQIPLDDGTCDAVFSFNSLDHVENVERTIDEIKRVTRIGGVFLLLVEVNHPPTACEPHTLSPPQLLSQLQPELVCHHADLYRPCVHGMYQSIRANEKLSNPETSCEKGYFSAMFTRRAGP